MVVVEFAVVTLAALRLREAFPVVRLPLPIRVRSPALLKFTDPKLANSTSLEAPATALPPTLILPAFTAKLPALLVPIIVDEAPEFMSVTVGASNWTLWLPVLTILEASNVRLLAAERVKS